MRTFILSWIVGGCLAAGAVAAAPASPASTPVTLSSDSLEIQDNGARSVFAGHVVLKQADSVMYADRMTRVGEKGPVEATGRVVRGFSKGEKGETIEVLGTRARYEPESRKVFVWGKPRVTTRFTDEKGRGDFESDRAQASLAAHEAQLIGRVRGRITPL